MGLGLGHSDWLSVGQLAKVSANNVKFGLIFRNWGSRYSLPSLETAWFMGVRNEIAAAIFATWKVAILKTIHIQKRSVLRKCEKTEWGPHKIQTLWNKLFLKTVLNLDFWVT